MPFLSRRRGSARQESTQSFVRVVDPLIEASVTVVAFPVAEQNCAVALEFSNCIPLTSLENYGLIRETQATAEAPRVSSHYFGRLRQ